MSDDIRTFQMTISARFKLVSWDDLKAGESFYYYLMRSKIGDQEPHGPFVMVDPATCRIRNGQNVELPFERYKTQLQPMRLLPQEGA